MPKAAERPERSSARRAQVPGAAKHPPCMMRPEHAGRPSTRAVPDGAGRPSARAPERSGITVNTNLLKTAMSTVPLSRSIPTSAHASLPWSPPLQKQRATAHKIDTRTAWKGEGGNEEGASDRNHRAPGPYDGDWPATKVIMARNGKHTMMWH